MTQQITDFRASITANVNARLASDKAQSMTANNRKKLESFRDQVAQNDAIAALLVACNYSADAVNQNVYSVEKAHDIARSAASEKQNFLSIYCNALFNSALALEKAEIEITRDVVASLCSNDVKTKFDSKIKATRVQSVKSASTIATQHNSTINAFLALHMLNVTRNSANDECFTLNRENAAIKSLAKARDITL